ncbi:hypothetical protein KUV57_12285 [Epibacterium sp. DP7N7-1]|nr:hypothetical protein [Epibacterium sp. DP7N7-1]
MSLCLHENSVYLKAECGVRYWEDATVNGVQDSDGDLIPCRNGEVWSPVIHLATGKIKDWPSGCVAKLHYKVCDDGRYTLLDEEYSPTASIEGYVPTMMCPGGSGFGDYVIMDVDGEGQIAGWHADLDPFQN